MLSWNPFKRTQKPNGTYEGSRVGNLIRRGASAVTGIGPQPVFFDYDMGKLKVDIATRVGKKSFQIIGNNAAELKADYDRKLGHASDSALVSAAKAAASGISRGANTAASYVPRVRNPLYYNTKKSRGGRRYRRGTRRA